MSINLKSLLKNISQEDPCGIDLRKNDYYRDDYYEVKDARNKARTIERKQLSGETDADSMSYWKMVSTKGIYLIKEQTKDLEIACWLTEAWLRQDGFYGLAKGVELIYFLLKNFPDDIYPLPDEDGLESRFAALIGLNGIDNQGSLIQPIQNQLIVNSENLGSYAMWQYQQAIAINKIQDQKIINQKLEAGFIDINVIKKAAKETPKNFYDLLQKQLKLVLEKFEQLQDYLVARYHHNAPPSSHIKNALTLFNDHLNFILHDLKDVDTKISHVDVIKENESQKKSKDVEFKVQPYHQKLSKMSRESSLKDLAAIANFFRITEPHSPISYGIDNIINWGQMSLPELMQLLISDDVAKNNFLKLIGLKDMK